MINNDNNTYTRMTSNAVMQEYISKLERLLSYQQNTIDRLNETQNSIIIKINDAIESMQNNKLIVRFMALIISAVTICIVSGMYFYH